MADVAPIFAAADVALSADADHAAIASELDTITLDFILAAEALAADTPGELADWTRAVELRALELLACFSRASDFSDPLDAAARVLRGPTGIDENGNALLVRPDLDDAVQHLRGLAHRAGQVAEAYEAFKGQPRQPAWLEVHFFRRLGQVFEAAVGRRWGVGTTTKGERTSPGVRFCAAVGRHIEARQPAGNAHRSDVLQAALRRLQSSNAAAERIREAKQDVGGPVRKR